MSNHKSTKKFVPPEPSNSHICDNCKTTFQCVKTTTTIISPHHKLPIQPGTCTCTKIKGVKKNSHWCHYCQPCSIALNIPE